MINNLFVFNDKFLPNTCFKMEVIHLNIEITA